MIFDIHPAIYAFGFMEDIYGACGWLPPTRPFDIEKDCNWDWGLQSVKFCGESAGGNFCNLPRDHSGWHEMSGKIFYTMQGLL